jgi:hypothetical protein
MYMAGKVILTNGDVTFTAQVYVDGSRVSAQAHSQEYVECISCCCDHSEAPEGAEIWHDASNTETLWKIGEV